MFNKLRLPPLLPHTDDEETTQKRYHYWRIRTFYSMFLGYIAYYLTRKAFVFAIPALIENFHFSRSQLGFIVSISSISYGLSKFTSGLLGDRSNPRYFMAIGLIMTALCNICLGFSSSLIAFGIFMGLNGFFQGWGWPGCARLLTHWYSRSERGRWWSAWNSCHNIGGALTPLVVAFCIWYSGWQLALFLPACISIFMAFFIINRMRDIPESLGLPPIEVHRGEALETEKSEKRNVLTTREILFRYVLKNPYIWCLAFANLFVYAIRIGISDWSMLYLMDQHQYTALGAGMMISWFEAGGFLGALAAGWLSDILYRGRRGPVNVVFAFTASIPLLGLWSFGSHSAQIVALCMFSTGFFIFGPQMLIGCAAAEVSHKKAAGTATGLTGLVSYLGAALAGGPLALLVDAWGWPSLFFSLAISSILCSLCLLPLWNLQGKAIPPKTKELKNS